jgi:neutral amino acid transport system permease protein
LRRRALLVLLVLFAALSALSGSAAAQEGAAEDEPVETSEWSVVGTQKDPDGAPIEGVEFTVSTADGEEIGDATSDEDGNWGVDLPGPGEYRAEMDTDTLPDGVALRNPDKNPLEFTVRTVGRPKIVTFLTGEGRSTRIALWRDLLNLTVSGVKFGLVIAMAAIGLSLIFGTTGLTNFAHGEMVTWGALVAYFLNVHAGLHLIPAALLAIGVGAVSGGLQDRLLWRPLRRRHTGLIAMMVVSIGLSLFVRNIFLFVFLGRTRPYADYAVQRDWEIGPIGITPKDLTSIVICVVVLVFVGLGLQRTRLGTAMRAVADNPDLAASSGIDVQRVVLYVWVFGGGLAALGGVLQAMGEQASFQQGFLLLLLMFAGVTLGGLGTAYGALVGSVVVGLLVELSTHWIPSEMKYLGALLVLIVILVVRPQGILGARERVG